MRFPRWRKMTWVLVIWTVIMGAWIVGGIISASSDKPSASCIKNAGTDLCNNAGDVGTGIGVVLLFLLWFIVFLVLGLIWLMSRPKHRTCAACGEDVKKGRTTCKKCGHSMVPTGAAALPVNSS